MNVNTEKYNNGLDDFIKRLQDKEIISKEIFLDENVSVEFNKSEIDKLLKTPRQLLIEDDELFVTIKGERHKISVETDVTAGKLKISSVLPEFNFDMDQDGNVSRQLEVEALYKVITVSKVFNNIYSDEIEEILELYDTNRMRTQDENYPFTSFLKVIQEESTFLMKIVLGACSIKISTYTSKNITITSSFLTPEERSSVDALKTEAKAIMFNDQIKIDAEKDPLKKKMLIYTKDLNFRKLINDSEVSTLYNITHLTTECLPFASKLKINKIARQCANEIISQDKTITDVRQRELLERDLRNKFRRRGHKQLLAEWKRSEYEKFKNDPSYVVRLKR